MQSRLSNMNTRDLSYFRILVEKRNYTEVAEMFSVSQPTITQAVKRLEKEFDSKLVHVDRVHQKTEITRSGYLLYEKSKIIQKSIDLARKEIKASDSEKIKFGLPPIIGTLYFPQVVQKLAQESLFQKLQISESGSSELLNELDNGNVDIAVIATIKPIHNPKYEVEYLGSRPFSVIVSAKNPLSKSTKPVDFRDLMAERFIRLTGKYIHSQMLEDYCKYYEIEPEVVYDTPDISWFKSLIRANVGIGILVRDEVGEYDRDLVCLDIANPLPESFNISVVRRKSYILKPDEQKLVDILQRMNIKNTNGGYY